MRSIIYCLIQFIIIPSQLFSQDLVPFNENKLWGYKDLTGDIVIKPQYQYAFKFVLKTAVVAKNDSFGVINEHNQVIIPIKYHHISQVDTTDFLFGYRKKYFGEFDLGIITKYNKVKIPPHYSYIMKHQTTRYTITRNVDSIMGKGLVGDLRSVKSFYGLTDYNGKILIPCEFDYLSWKNDSLIVLSKDNLQALYESSGRKLTGFDYKVIDDFIEGLAKVRIGDKYGFIDPQGKAIIPVELEYCERFNNGVAITSKSNRWGAIDKSGKLVIDTKFDYEVVKNMIGEKFGN